MTDERTTPSPRDEPTGPALEWDIATTPEVLSESGLVDRTALADAARRGEWAAVLKLARKNVVHVNAVRPGGTSGYAALHQAAHIGAPGKVVTSLLKLGAWRLLRAASGELPVDIAIRRGHENLVPLLKPQPRAFVEPEHLRIMEVYFHAVINGRAERLVKEHRLRLPRLEPLQEIPMRGVWMPVPGMLGGFHYWLARGSPDPLLVTTSWSRAVGGSGERHEITQRGLMLVEEGFV